MFWEEDFLLFEDGRPTFGYFFSEGLDGKFIPVFKTKRLTSGCATALEAIQLVEAAAEEYYG